VDEQRLLALLMSGARSAAALAEDLAMPLDRVLASLQALSAAGIAQHTADDRWQLLQVPDLHDTQRIAQGLSPAVRALLGELQVCWQLDSTNSELLRRTPPASGVAVLLAERQDGGRGRRGRVWTSPLARHVYLSLACRFDHGIRAMAGLSLVVGVLAGEALRGAGLQGVGIKWPNDLLLEGRKLGGILVESRGSAQGAALAVIGIGINVHGAPPGHPDIDQPWTSIDRHCPALASRDRVVQLLLESLLPGLLLFQRQGLPAFLERYAALDVLAGVPVWIEENGQRHAAQALGLAADGALRVVDHHGERRLHAGDVSVRKQ
jgi:BirA family transcriptional regulator, biotin operon repressor / biotin---[acetyl-CoA-carboxylase] ligase